MKYILNFFLRAFPNHNEFTIVIHLKITYKVIT